MTPWGAVCEPHDRERGRHGVERLLRMYVAQQCLGLEGIEAIYDSQAIRRFVGIDLAVEAAPDAATGFVGFWSGTL